MLASIVALAVLQTNTKVWFGPTAATFRLKITGNPYDPEENDVRVEFRGLRGQRYVRMAYFDDGVFRAVLVAPESGAYTARAIRNGIPQDVQPLEGKIELIRQHKRGFIRKSAAHLNRFRWDNGESFFPLGFNLGWQNGDILPMSDQIRKMSQNGVNWTRIWASSWDSKNPWWPQNDANHPLTQLWPKALDNWHKVIAACEVNDVPFQMVLFNHGSFSSRVNPNWPDHPWNTAKGGFLRDAADFFTNSEAKRRTKMWLRYAVARWGHVSRLMAWELFNEVEWVDARYADRWQDIIAWHEEMAAYLRGIDPYRHLITTSSALEQEALWNSMDYYQPHTYPPDVWSAIAGADLPNDKPGFFGEFGPGGATPVRQALRDGIYGGMFANHAGAGQYWSWDVVEKQNLYSEFATAAKVLAASQLASHAKAKPVTLTVGTDQKADLVFGPGRGWAKTEQAFFALPQDANPRALSKLSGYLQSSTGGNKSMSPGPLAFEFHADQPGEFRIALGQLSRGGARVVGTLNGKPALDKDYPASTADRDVREVLKIAFPAGLNRIEIENTGADWARMDGFTATGIAPAAKVAALGESDWMMLRLQKLGDASEVRLRLARLGLRDGRYQVTTFNLESGERSVGEQRVRAGSVTPIMLKDRDQVAIYRRLP